MTELMRTIATKNKFFLVGLVSLITLISGLEILLLAVHPEDFATRFSYMPPDLLYVSEYFCALLGSVLVITSINIFKRKEIAFKIKALLVFSGIVLGVLEGLHISALLYPSLLLVTLVYTRDLFTVKSALFTIKLAFDQILLMMIFLLSAVVVGFWFLDPWSMTTLAILLCSYSLLFKPASYAIKNNAQDRKLVKSILDEHGNSSLCFFKLQADKSYFFSGNNKAFLAYKVQDHCAIVLGDPVGDFDDVESLIADFDSFCTENDWLLAFFQTPDYLLDSYQRIGYKKLKIGDEAIIELDKFNLDGKKKRELRYKINKFGKEGFLVNSQKKPITEDLLDATEKISDEWLKAEDKRERSFSLGMFDRDYIKHTDLYYAKDKEDSVLAFVNLIPSYHSGELAIDLMRRINMKGIMDYLFIKLLLDLKERGYKRCSMGLAPMSGFFEHENASIVEVAIHKLFQGLNFLFNYAGLRMYKDKFATCWEPRYLVYKNVNDLPKLALAIKKLLETV